MKTTLKIFTIAIMMIMGVFSVSAQSTILFIEIQSFLASIQGLDAEFIISSEITTTENYFFVEEKLALEDWMVDQDNWDTASGINTINVNEASKEEGLVLEDWMVDQSSVEAQQSWDFLRVDIEPPLKVEDWMICKEPWCKQKLTEGINSFTL
jgi:hypothetical protein